MKIAITAESTIDLPKELLAEFDIKTIPFEVMLGDKVYHDGEIAPTEIFDYFDKNKVLPKTCALNYDEYKNFFQKSIEGYDALIHFNLSSEISSTYQNAVNAANDLQNVFVVDSKSLSTGIALLAIYARKLANQNLDAFEVVEKVTARVPAVQASFVIKKLTYLHKGGRCSTLAYYAANLLMMRPSIIVKDGKMTVHKKYMGNMEKVVAKYCEDTLNEFNTPDLDTAFITFPSATDGMINIAKSALEKRGFKNIYITTAGATIASHCGENTLGILYFNDGNQN